MANTKLRNIRFYRNGQVSAVESSEQIEVKDLKSAYKKAEQDFIGTGRHNDMLDGEILLYRFSYNGQVHTLVGVVHAPETGTKSLEVLANYDMLGAEISNEIAAAIAELDGSATIATVTNDVVTLKAGIVQTDGKVAQGTGNDITLAKVAKTGAAADVSIADTEGVIEATTVEGALAEIAKEIDAMDSSLATTAESQANKLVKLGYTQVDGVITSLTSDETALEDALDELKNATTLKGVDAIKVDYSETANTVSLIIPEDEKVLSQDGTGLKSTISLSYDSSTTTIHLKGINDVDLGTIDASDFVKDGILQDVVIVEGTGVAEEGQTQVLEDGHKYFRFTYKTVYYDENNETVDTTQVVYLDVESLVDTYTAGNEWIVIDPDTNKISHITQGAFTQKEGQDAPKTTFGANTDDATADAAGESVEFKVPSFTVDAAGHVTAASEKTIKVALPATRTANSVTVTPNTELGLTSKNVQLALEELQTEINTINAVDWSGDDEIKVNNDDHTIKHTDHKVSPTQSDNKNEDGDIVKVKSVVIPQLTVNDYGHVTAIDDKTFEIDFNITTVIGTEGQIVVTPTEGTEDVNYTVSLAEAKAEYAETVNDSFDDDDTNTFTFIKKVETDNFGRVTKVETVTMSENWDCGRW